MNVSGISGLREEMQREGGRKGKCVSIPLTLFFAPAVKRLSLCFLVVPSPPTALFFFPGDERPFLPRDVAFLSPLSTKLRAAEAAQ